MTTHIVANVPVLEFVVDDTRNRLVCILSEIPEWVKAPEGTVTRLGAAMVEPTTKGGLYRVYATVNQDKEITGFVFRPYYGGVWMPVVNEVKLCDVDFPTACPSCGGRS